MSPSTSSFTQSAPGIAHLREDFAAQAGHADGVVGREAAGRVGQDRVPPGVDEIQQVLALGVDQPLAADRHGDALGARDVQRLAHRLVAGVLARADDQPAGERVRADPQFVRRSADSGAAVELPPTGERAALSDMPILRPPA